MNYIKAKKDPNILGTYFGEEPETFAAWDVCLRGLYGSPIRKRSSKQLVSKCMGRDVSTLKKNGYNTALITVGRRGGKSKNIASVASYEALFGDLSRICPGEIPCVSVIAPTKDQAQIDKNYIRAVFKSSAMLEREIIGEDKKSGFELKNGVVIKVLAGDFRTVRGYTQICVVVDEAAFFGLTEESKVKSDSELISAIRPSLITTGGKLIVITTKYAKKGWVYKTWKANYGNPNAKIFVWDADSKTMNPTLSQQDIDNAIAEDPVGGRAEFYNEWRDDVGCYLPREVFDAVTVKSRQELLPKKEYSYTGFADVSGGRFDSACLAISHKSEGKIILDCLREFKPPFNPNAVVEKMADDLKRYNLNSCVGDAYAAEFTVSAFRRCGIKYIKSDKNKSQIYLEAIPIICSQVCELLDNETLISQFSNLQRKTRSGGCDIVDHISGGKDDVCNAAAGSIVYAGKPQIVCGGVAWATRRTA